jgi:hypothetical protein
MKREGMSFTALSRRALARAAPTPAPASPAAAPAPDAVVAAGTAAGAGAAGKRDLRLDFFRGIALFLIFIDHIPGNLLSHFTIQAIGFSDAAEIFIFVSGYTAALVYGQAMLKRGWLVAAARVLYRVWQLYVAHIFVFLLYAALVAFSALNFEGREFGRELHVVKFFTEPYIAVIRVLELRFQPTFLDILPVYIVLLAAFPVVLPLIRRHALAALVPSLAIYLAVQFFGVTLYGYPGWRPWFFNPFAWQLLFVIGATCGYARYSPHSRLGAVVRRLLGPAAVICLAAAVIRLSWTLHDSWGAVPALLLDQFWPIDKSNLAPLRLLHFLALAVLVASFVAPDARFLRWRAAQPVIRCGQYSLQIFCLGILLAVIGHFVLDEWRDTVAVQLATNAAGILLMIGTATLISWYRALDRAAERA